jgi:F1F0 ATPase subunit 2
MMGEAWRLLRAENLSVGGLSAVLFVGLIGALLGSAFYGGLWWTVRRAAVARRPARWFLGSLLVRMSIALLGIYAVGRHSGARMLICLLGFMLARPLVLLLERELGRQGAVRCAAGD